MPYPNQYDATAVPYVHSGTLDQTDTNQTGQPENYQSGNPSYNDAQDQFFLPLTPGVTYEFQIHWETNTPNADWILELAIFRLSGLSTYKWWRIVSDASVQARDDACLRWTVPSGVDASARLAVILAGLLTPPKVDYAITITQVSEGPSSGARYGNF